MNEKTRKLMKKKKDLKYTLERLYKCRDLEITNLWQRSVFLSVFMFLCFSGYGYLVDKIVTRDDYTTYSIVYDCKGTEKTTLTNETTSICYALKKCICTQKQEFATSAFKKKPTIKQSTTLAMGNYNLVAFGIAMMGIVFSILWIAMAKSSKAWYEVYENAISDFEYENYSKLGIPYPYVMGNMGLYKNQKDNQKDNCILSTKAGAYSPSKINIVIGQVSFFIWIIVVLIHLLDCLNLTCSFICCIITIILIIVFITLICVRLLCIMKSNFLDTNPILARLSKNYPRTSNFYRENFNTLKRIIDSKEDVLQKIFEKTEYPKDENPEGESTKKEIVKAINNLIRTRNVTKDDFKEKNWVDKKSLYCISKFLLALLIIILVFLALIGLLCCK
jgi:bacitracin transport system permease protein